jgi:hypothetical protein
VSDDVNREGGDGRRMWEMIDTVGGAVCCILAWNICIWNFMLQICIADLAKDIYSLSR